MQVTKFIIVTGFLCTLMLVSMCSALSLYMIFSRFGLYGEFIGHVVGALTWAIPNLTFFYKFSGLNTPVIQTVQSKVKKSFIIIAMLSIFPLMAEFISTSLLAFRTLKM